VARTLPITAAMMNTRPVRPVTYSLMWNRSSRIMIVARKPMAHIAPCSR